MYDYTTLALSSVHFNAYKIFEIHPQAQALHWGILVSLASKKHTIIVSAGAGSCISQTIYGPYD
jgi:hypothetical protein